MKYLLIISTIFALSFHGNAQKKNTGFYGKTFFIEANSAISYPLFNRLGDGTTGRFEQKDNFASAINLVVGKAVSRKISLSVEGGMFFGNFSARTSDVGYYSDGIYETEYNPKHAFRTFEQLSYRTLSIMPKIEISGIGGNAPGGLSHQIGFGFTSSSLVDRDYDYTLSSDYPLLPEAKIADFNQKFKGYTVLYAVNLRYPISKSLFFNYGVRTTLNLTKSNYYPSTTVPYFVPNNEAEESIKRTRFRTVFNLQLGFTFLLF